MSNVDSLARPEARTGTVVCTHASAGSGRQLQALSPWLDRALHICTPDLLGYGADESWPAGRPVSLAEEAARLEPLLDAEAGGVHLLGHSYGGAVALELALRRPPQVRSPTLYEPVRFGLLINDPAVPAGAEQIQSVGLCVQMLVLSGRLHEAAAFFVDYWSGAGSWTAMDGERQAGVARRMPKVQADFGALFADRVPDTTFAALTMPVQLIGGRRSPLPARQVLGRLAALLPQAGCSWIDGAGHMAPVTQPGQVAAYLPAWLRPVEERRVA